MTTVVGLFQSKDQAEKAIQALKDKDISSDKISLVSKDAHKDAGRGDMEAGKEFGKHQDFGGQARKPGARGRKDNDGDNDFEAAEDLAVGENVTDGTAWGGGLGGVAGLLASAGALAIPGIGPIVAAGPLAATLSGAVAGGIAGGLLDLGVPESEGRHIEDEVKQGRILAAIETDQKKADEVAEILRREGADSVKVHDKS